MRSQGCAQNSPISATSPPALASMPLARSASWSLAIPSASVVADEPPIISTVAPGTLSPVVRSVTQATACWLSVMASNPSLVFCTQTANGSLRQSSGLRRDGPTTTTRCELIASWDDRSIAVSVNVLSSPVAVTRRSSSIAQLAVCSPRAIAQWFSLNVCQSLTGSTW